jgi:hypothetical protein
MNQLPTKINRQLIAALESGQMTEPEAAGQLARIAVANRDPYTQTLVSGLILGGLAWALTGSAFIPVAIGLVTWDSYRSARRRRIAAYQDISRGNFIEYLPEIDRALFETASPQASQPTIQGQDATPKAETVTTQTAQPPVSAQVQSPQLQNLKVIDIAAALGFNLKPTIVSARPRTSKGIIVSHAIPHAKQHHGATVWVLQPKPHANELGYWKQADRFLGLNLEDYPKDDPAIAAQMTEFFTEWRAQRCRPILLIVDELVKIQALQPKWYRDFLIPQCIVEGSSGETDRRFLYLVTQSPLVTDLGMSGGNRSAFDFLTIQTEATANHLESVRKSVTSLRSTPAPGDYQRSPVGRLAFHSAANCWFAVPEYPVPTIEPGDRLCPDLEAIARPAPAYAVVTTAPELEPIALEPPPLPPEWEAIARLTIAQSFPSSDPIEFALVGYFARRPGQVKSIRDILAAKIPALEGIKSQELRDYLACLAAENKLREADGLYQFAG